MSHPLGAGQCSDDPQENGNLRAAPGLAGMGDSGLFTGPPTILQDEHWFEGCYTVSGISTGRDCLQNPRKPNGL